MTHASHRRVCWTLDSDAELVSLHAEHWGAGTGVSTLGISSATLVVEERLIGLEEPVFSQCSQVLR